MSMITRLRALCDFFCRLALEPLARAVSSPTSSWSSFWKRLSEIFSAFPRTPSPFETRP